MFVQYNTLRATQNWAKLSTAESLSRHLAAACLKRLEYFWMESDYWHSWKNTSFFLTCGQMQRIKVIQNVKLSSKFNVRNLSCSRVPGIQSTRPEHLQSQKRFHKFTTDFCKSWYLFTYFTYFPHANKAQLLQTRKHHRRRESPRPRVRMLNGLMH